MNKIKTRYFGKKIHFLDVCDSTMDYAERCPNLSHGDIIISETQTAGHGRIDHSWESPLGSLYLSIILENNPDKFNALIPISALSVYDVISAFSNPTIKWPNDILVDNRKISGICMKKTENNVIIGIGINVNSCPDDLNATSVKNIVGHEYNIEDVIIDLLNSFEERYYTSSDLVTDEWKKKLNIIGKNIIIRTPSTFCGVVENLTDEGFLVVKHDDGKSRIFCAGDLSVVQ